MHSLHLATASLGLALGSTMLVAQPAVADRDEPNDHDGPSSSVVLAWERTSIRTIYTENASPVPVGALYLGFTSLAMDRAASRADHVGHAAEIAAAAVAAHDVLVNYFPASVPALDADLATSLGQVPDSSAEAKGVRIGARAAAKLIADRADDGRGDTSIVYSRPPGIGVWQPAPGAAMLVPWLGYVRPLVVSRLASAPGPEQLDSAEWARDYEETRLLGAASGSSRTPAQTDTALFFNSNSATMLTEGLLRYLDAHPLGLLGSTHLFAAIHAAEADSVIAGWRQKYDVGFWRPIQAVALADRDGNVATTAQPGWVPLLATPSYSEYVSGHAVLTAPVAEVIRREFGDDLQLTLHSYNTNADRTYASLSAIEADALESRIWGGLHFRAAMDDGYAMGHRTARVVLKRLD